MQEPNFSPVPNLPADPEGEPAPKLVQDALRHILDSPSFRPSKRGKQFLDFVVRYRLDNPPEPLKERTIGVALFNRSADYATGDDSVVRAQAREVRRRLDQYYLTSPHDSPVRIELPVGSYSPVFSWVPTPPRSLSAEPPDRSALTVATAFVDQPLAPPSSIPSARRSRRPLFGIATVLLCLLGAVGLWSYTRRAAQRSTISQFWAPAFASPKPLLISLPKPILYRPSADVYKRTAQYPGEFDREVYRMTHRPHLKPDDSVHWSDMVEFYDYGVSEGDVQAAVRLSNFFGHQGEDSEVRIGDGLSSEDLRNSPAVVIGAFSNPWTMELMSGLHYTFVDDNQGIRIQERGGQSWYPQHGAVGEDYGLVTRLVDSSTGQFVVLLAGVEASGSDAAADVVVRPELLESILRNAPKNWQKKNVQILVSTSVSHSIAGPPKVIGIYVW